jgi:hypothetical protein
MAWQKLFETEAGLRSDDSSIQGTLNVECNDFSQRIEYDVQHGDDYSTDWLTFTDQEKQILKGIGPVVEKYAAQPGVYASKMVDQTFDPNNNKDNTVTTAEMLALAHDFPFMVYSIKYSMQPHFQSLLFGGDALDNSYLFYPYRRQFYHRGEAYLDDALFNALLSKTEDEVAAAAVRTTGVHGKSEILVEKDKTSNFKDFPFRIIKTQQSQKVFEDTKKRIEEGIAKRYGK